MNNVSTEKLGDIPPSSKVVVNVSLEGVAQDIGNAVADHNTDEAAHPYIREAIEGAGGLVDEAKQAAQQADKSAQAASSAASAASGFASSAQNHANSAGQSSSTASSAASYAGQSASTAVGAATAASQSAQTAATEAAKLTAPVTLQDQAASDTLPETGTITAILQTVRNFCKWVKAEFAKYLPLTGGTVKGQVLFWNQILSLDRVIFARQDSLTGAFSHLAEFGADGMRNEEASLIAYPTGANGAKDGDHFVTSSMLLKKQDAQLVVSDTSTTSVTLAPVRNVLYKYGTLNALNVTALGDFNDEYVIMFTAGADFAFDNTAFDGNWIGAEQSPTFEEGVRYVISVRNGIAVLGGVGV